MIIRKDNFKLLVFASNLTQKFMEKVTFQAFYANPPHFLVVERPSLRDNGEH